MSFELKSSKVLIERTGNIYLLLEKINAIRYDADVHGKVYDKHIEELVSYITEGPLDRIFLDKLYEFFKTASNYISEGFELDISVVCSEKERKEKENE